MDSALVIALVVALVIAIMIAHAAAKKIEPSDGFAGGHQTSGSSPLRGLGGGGRGIGGGGLTGGRVYGPGGRGSFGGGGEEDR